MRSDVQGGIQKAVSAQLKDMSLGIMHLRLGDHLDSVTLQRGQDYARRGLVLSFEAMADGTLRGEVSNGRGNRYRQRIRFGRGVFEGDCSCPVGVNCKHVAAVLITWAERQGKHPDRKSVV
jgi:uncharacterized Zn finger protein